MIGNPTKYPYNVTQKNSGPSPTVNNDFLLGQFIYVNSLSPNADDSRVIDTSVIGNPYKPYLTIEGALNALAVFGTVLPIRLAQGTSYAENLANPFLGGEIVLIYGEPNTLITINSGLTGIVQMERFNFYSIQAVEDIISNSPSDYSYGLSVVFINNTTVLLNSSYFSVQEIKFIANSTVTFSGSFVQCSDLFLADSALFYLRVCQIECKKLYVTSIAELELNVKLFTKYIVIETSIVKIASGTFNYCYINTDKFYLSPDSKIRFDNTGFSPSSFVEAFILICNEFYSFAPFTFEIGGGGAPNISYPKKLQLQIVNYQGFGLLQRLAGIDSIDMKIILKNSTFLDSQAGNAFIENLNQGLAGQIVLYSYASFVDTLKTFFIDNDLATGVDVFQVIAPSSMTNKPDTGTILNTIPFTLDVNLVVENVLY